MKFEHLLDLKFEQSTTSHHPTHYGTDHLQSGDFHNDFDAALLLHRLEGTALQGIPPENPSPSAKVTLPELDEANYSETMGNHATCKDIVHVDMIRRFDCVDTASRLAIVEVILYSLSSAPSDYNDLMYGSTIASRKEKV